MDDNRLDDFFKEHLDNFQDDGPPDGGWNKMNHVLLEQSQVRQKGFFINKKILWGIAALILLLICTFFYGIRSQNQQIKMLHSSIELLKEELDGRGRTPSRVDTLVLLAGPDGKLHAISLDKLTELAESELAIDSPASPTKIPNSASTFTPNHPFTQNSPSHPEHLSKETYTPDTVFLHATEIGVDSSKLLAQTSSQDSVPISTLPEEIKQKELDRKELAKIDSVKKDKPMIVDKPNPKQKEEPKRDPFFQRLKKQLGFRSGAEVFLAGGGTEYGEISPIAGGGLGLELRIGERFALRSGVRLANIKYELDDLEDQLLSEDFFAAYPGVDGVDPAANLHELKMSGTYVEIPLGLRYYYPMNRKIQVFSGVDFTGGSYLAQDFTYEFIQDGGEFSNRAKSSQNPWRWGTGRLSLGAAYGLKSNWQFESALFFEKDFSGRGVEGYKFYAIGLSTSIWLSQK